MGSGGGVLVLNVPPRRGDQPAGVQMLGWVHQGLLYVAPMGTPLFPPPPRGPAWVNAGPVDGLTDTHTVGRLWTAYWAMHGGPATPSRRPVGEDEPT